MKKRIGIALLLASVVFTTTSIPVLAVADPDTPLAVNAVYVYEGLLETGDVGVFVDYFIDYSISGNPPTGETASEAYLLSFIDIDGVTQLRTVFPFSFQDSGYSRGMIWLYWSAAEATADGLDRANIALYSVWFMGNPTVPSGWAGAPPKTIAALDFWQPDGANGNTLLALRVLTMAEILETAWAIDLIEVTTLGSKLTPQGETYFINSMTNLREMAPLVFIVTTEDQVQEDIDYSTSFGATMTDGTGTVAGSPITLASGATIVNILAIGTFTLELNKGTFGAATTNIAVVTGSPVTLVSGTNTITIPLVIGLLDIDVALEDTVSSFEATVIGTGFDATVVAAEFGMTRWMMSGLIWLIVSIVICAAYYKIGERTTAFGSTGGSGKGILLVFDLCLIGGTVLGLLHPVVAVLMFIGMGIFTAYVLFFKGASF